MDTEKDIEPQENSNDWRTAITTFSFKTVLILVLLAIIAGMIGGVYGALYLAKQPFVQGWLQASNVDSSVTRNLIYQEQSDLTELVEKVTPAVVSIVVEKDVNMGGNLQYSPFFGFPFEVPTPPTSNEPNIQQIGAGTGFFVSRDGLIMTNKHVVSDTTATYTVVTSDGKSLPATVLALDPVNDLALVKVDHNSAPYLEFADSSTIKLGQQVVAIGNSLGQYQNTITSGIVSGIGRSITAGSSSGSEQLDGVIQTDAAINPGNSGGPLMNLAGQVIGINTAIDRQGQSVGFAISANDAKQALQSYQTNGRITRSFLGVRYTMLSEAVAKQNNLPRNGGALIIRGNLVSDFAVLPGSPADRAGLKENDIILELDGKQLTRDNNLARMLKNYQPGDIVTMKVFSAGEEKTIQVTLGENQ